MKCKLCKKRLSNILIEHHIEYKDISQKAINVPAYQCSQCGKIVIPDMILLRLQGYALQARGKIVDFAKHEQQENEDLVTLHMLGLM